PGGAAGRDGGHEALRDTGGLQRRLEVGDVRFDRLVPRVGQLADAHGTQRGPRPGRDARVGVGVGGSEPQAIATVGEAREHDFAGPRPLGGHVVETAGAELEPSEPLERVAPPRAIVHAVPHRLAELAVARYVDPQALLVMHDVGDAGAQLVLEAPLIGGSARFAGAVGVDQVVGPRQAPGVTREDVVLTAPPDVPSRRDEEWPASSERSRRVYELRDCQVTSAP